MIVRGTSLSRYLISKPPRDFFAGNDLQPERHPMSSSFPIAVLLLVKGILISSDAANI